MKTSKKNQQTYRMSEQEINQKLTEIQELVRQAVELDNKRKE